MGQQDSKPQQASANGVMSNADTNSVTIIEQVKSHSDLMSILLSIIVLLLIIQLLYKLYQIHTKRIAKKAVQKSRRHIEEI